jgi:predicted kinase
MSLVIIGIGVPGSGKTTYLKKFAEQHGLAYINKDDIRAELLGDVNDQSKNREIWLESERRITDALARGQSLVLDSTYAERWKREELITSLKKRGATRVVGVYFDIPLERAMAQNNARERAVSEKNMHWFWTQLVKEPPTLAEGYGAIYRPIDLDRGVLKEELRSTLVR